MGKLMMDTKRLFLSPCEETDETGTSCLKKENSFIPPYRSMNFPVYSGMLDQFKDSKDLQHYYEQGGLNGLEVILAGESDQGKILPEMINGVHLFFQVFWMDFWLRDFERLDKEFDSRDQWVQFYGGMDRDAYLDYFRRDLDYAQKVGAKYVVFHVSEVTLEESFIYRYKYSNRQIIDAAIEVINILMSEREYSFDFLVENLWFSGLTMKEPAVTRRLIEGIEYEKKGIMLDLGHYMNTNTRLRTPGQAVDYLHRMLDLHEKRGFPVTDWIKGIHLQMSLGGSYTMKHKREWKKGKNRLNFDEIPFYELFRLAYEHVNNIDQHLPFLEEGVKELIRRIGPEYITFEFKQRSKEEYLQYITDQGKMLAYV